ncbi:ATP-dependent helicase [Methylobacterium sp. Leaf100]|uniref:ATP-dependent helicase n=1 Tax=Methylobacterium sp. Leaf100 TaxID=1736252 RepID=UPI0006FC728A|nr:ATP-dependent helicase [Methylobacterium sp. Leaf100]KQP32830.1 hypothetical protein ASF25_17585 [Methylobacterium sp. Leaf100]
MDTFEAVRIEAARIHAEAVAAGADPLDALQVVLAAIETREIDVSWLKPGDPYLRGGRGLYDPHLGAIVCEDIGSEADRALLAGHELGHAVLHDPGEAIIDRHIDPSRPAEGAASGVEKVADYGRRERREVQADLFARELALPRALARRLFIEDGLNARAIAARTRLPYPVVAEQLLDALLLPPYLVHRQAPERPAAALDASQDAAARHEGSPFLLQAGPGTGKTKTLISRIERLVNAGEDPGKILVLTFSNKAAGELSERLTTVSPESASAVWVGTFHGFGLDVLRRFHDKEGLPDNPRLVDRADAVGLLEDMVPRLPLRFYRNLHDPTLDLGEILRAISRAKDELVDPERYMTLARRMVEAADASGDEKERTRAAKAVEVAEVYKVYDAEMRRAGLLDFGDLVMRPSLLLERDPEVVSLLRAKHQHILVDEYQDVNRASVRIIQALAGSGERLWVVGDSRQSIYRFRGASSVNMSTFRTDFPGGTLDQLRVNYRSSPEVVHTFVRYAGGMLASRGVLPLDLHAHAHPTGQGPELRRVEHPDDEPAAVAARIMELGGQGVAFRDQAILCRGNGRLADIADELEKRDIPVLFLGNLFERPEVRDLLALIMLLVDPKASSFPRIATLPAYALDLADLGRMREAMVGSKTPMAWLPVARAGLGADAQRALDRLAADLDGLDQTSHPWNALCHLLLDRTDLVRTLLASTRISDRLRMIAIRQLMTFCRALPEGAGLPIQRLVDRARRLVLLSEERDLRQMPAAAGTMDAVNIMTVHASKGLEFEAVHIPGMVVSGFPGANQTPRCPPPDGMIAGTEGMTGIEAVKAGHDEEEQCLFFVAMSRARSHLSFYAASRMANGNRRSPSPFLAAVAASTTVRDDPALLMPSRTDPSAHRIPMRWSEPPRFTAEQVSLYEKCPKRFFYTHVLGMSGGRRSTAFVQMHDVVYAVMRWLRTDPERWHLAAGDVEAHFNGVWQEKGPIRHGYAEDYRLAGLDLVQASMRSRIGHPFGDRTAVELTFEGLSVIVEPDEVRGSDGALTFRRVRSGRKGATEEDDLIYGLYLLAARRRHGTDAQVEAIHLSEDRVTAIDLNSKKLANRETKMREMAAAILAGDFAPYPDDRSCPRCPHYVTCGPLPGGTLLRP